MYTNIKNNLQYKRIKKVKNSKEYLQNEMQINCIKDVLINHSDVPEELFNLLIDSVEKNTLLLSKVYEK